MPSLAHLLFILMLGAILVRAAASKGDIRRIDGAPSGTRYVYIPASLAVNRADAESACRLLGMSLAPIPSVEDLLWVGGVIREAAWIRSFGGRLEGACIAAFQGGGVAVPVGECEANQAVLCAEERKGKMEAV
jgi:hypothetical protein